MIRYAITDRRQFGSSEDDFDAGLLEQVGRLCRQGVDFIQLREKDLPAAKLATLARSILKTIRDVGGTTRLLINSRTDIAVATGAEGVHLPAGPEQLTPRQVRQLFVDDRAARLIMSISCHTLAEVGRAHEGGANLILFGPVFGKTLDGQQVTPGTGIEMLRTACFEADATPVIALGGVTNENAAACIVAGAGGIAGIRLFHQT